MFIVMRQVGVTFRQIFYCDEVGWCYLQTDVYCDEVCWCYLETDVYCDEVCWCYLETDVYTQGRLNNIIGPRAKQCTEDPTYTTTHGNKNVNGRYTCIFNKRFNLFEAYFAQAYKYRNINLAKIAAELAGKRGLAR